MNWFKWTEFFKDDKGRLSTTNLSFMLAVFTMTFVVLYTTIYGTITDGILWVYASLCTLGLVTKKGFDALNRGSSNDSTNS